MYRPFLRTTTLDEALERYVPSFAVAAAVETVFLPRALGRPLATDCRATSSLPGFPRSSVDGFAVRAADTFGASDGNPLFLSLAGTVAMGRPAELALAPGTAIEVPTGGHLPDGADGVVMVEHVERLGSDVGVRRPIAPAENVIGPADDVAAGELVLRRGHRVGPSDIGLLAAMGMERVEVFQRLTVTVVATGDEVVDWRTAAPAPGCIRNVNGPLVAALLERSGHVVLDGGIVPDRLDALTTVLAAALARSALVLVSGGSSAGARDYTCQAIEGLPDGAVDIHGLQLSPGKPTILGRAAGKPVIGLPGHPVSCAVVVDRVVRPTLRRLAGEDPWLRGPDRRVVMTENVASKPGREDYVRVRLASCDGGWRATPVRGPSGAVATLVRSDGVVRIPLNEEGLTAGTEADFFLLNE